MARYSKKKKVIEMCVLIFSTTFVWNTSHSKKNSASYYHKSSNVSCREYPSFLSDFHET